ncbi:MAG TPA: DNA gyrase inhibitor YacG [Acidobacteriota bacterium]|nr:DNA gyrase inhibitor YacG [Acidobacteriota bacterium]
MKAACPRCGKETETEQNPFRPFCGERCKLIDLGNWISGTYNIPGADPADNGSDDFPPAKENDA